MQQDTQPQNDSILEIDILRLLQNILRTLKRLWLPIILIVALFAAAVVYVQQKSYTPSYKAYCTFSVRVVNKATLSDTNSLYAVYYDQDLAEQLDATFSYLLTSDLLTDDIKEYLGTDTIDGSIQANSIKGSNIFVLTTYSSTPEKASALLEALMAVYYDAARYVVGDMETEIIEGPVSSQAPHNTPSRTKGIVLGAAMGLVLCMGLIVLYTILRHTVFEPSDLEKHLNMPCFGVVPLLQSKRHLNDNLAAVSSTHEQGTFRESIRGIARKLENALSSHNAKVILVTSTASGEGKSVLSQNLAEVFAHWGKNVVLLDGDLRKPSLYRRFGYQQESMSLEAALSGEAPVDTVVRTRRNGKLTLILNSVPVAKPTVLIGSPAMKALIERYAAQADLVIIDTPPCGQLSDASLYQQYADGILYVVQQDRMSIHQIVEAAEAMYDSENKLLGYALNGAQQVPQGYGKYGYGKYSYGKYGGYGKYGYGKYGYGKYGSYSESDYTSEASDR